MTMTKKKNLDQRLESCGQRIIFMDRKDRNYQVKDTENLINYKTSKAAEEERPDPFSTFETV